MKKQSVINGENLSVRYEVYILLSESCLEEEKEYKIEDNP